MRITLKSLIVLFGDRNGKIWCILDSSQLPQDVARADGCKGRAFGAAINGRK